MRTHSLVRMMTGGGAAILSLLMAATSAGAQELPLAQVLPDLILRQITLQSPPLPAGVPGVPEGFTHVAHFSPIEAGELSNPSSESSKASTPRWRPSSRRFR